MSVRFAKLQPGRNPSPFQKILHQLSGIRIRLMLWYIVTTILVLLLFGSLLYSTIARTLPSTANKTPANAVLQVAKSYVTDGKLSSSEGPDNTLLINAQGELMEEQPLDSDLPPQLLPEVKRFIAANTNVGAACDTLSVAVRTSDSHTIATQDYDVCIDALQSHNQRSGTLVGIQRHDDYQATLQNILKQLLLIGLVILLVITLGGYWLATRAMRPVRLITRTAQEIGQTDLSRRFHLQSHDELGELAATFDGMLNRLEEAFKRLRQFTADASHELRTPLSIMNIATNRALSQWSRPENYEQALDMIEAHRQELGIIQAETDHMARLVNDLLTLARADTGQAILEKEELDMSEVILDVVERLAPLARQRGIALSLGELPELPLTGDRAYLTSMLTNLIDNALKYTSSTGSRVQVEAGTAYTDGKEYGWIRVEDDGPGIAEQHLPHLFHRFYRIDTARSSLSEQTRDANNGVESIEASSGSGLGLSIVQWVAQAHGGEVRVQSKEGYGTVFEVRLPLANHTN